MSGFTGQFFFCNAMFDSKWFTKSLQIFIEGRVRQKVRNPARNKTLVHSLNLNSTFEIGISSIGVNEKDADELGGVAAAGKPAKKILYKPEMLPAIELRSPPPVPVRITRL